MVGPGENRQIDPLLGVSSNKNGEKNSRGCKKPYFKGYEMNESVGNKLIVLLVCFVYFV